MLERHAGIHQAALIPVPDEIKGHEPSCAPMAPLSMRRCRWPGPTRSTSGQVGSRAGRGHEGKQTAPTYVSKVPAGPEWLHEIKHDGFRIRVERDGDRVWLIGYNWTKRYPWIGCRSLCAQVSGANRRRLVPRRLKLEHFGGG
jgi:hypothetical protein